MLDAGGGGRKGALMPSSFEAHPSLPSAHGPGGFSPAAAASPVRGRPVTNVDAEVERLPSFASFRWGRGGHPFRWACLSLP